MKPETISQFGENARMAEMICMMEMFKLEEEIGTNLDHMMRRTMIEVRYDSIEKLVWDHSVSSLKVTTEFFFFLLFQDRLFVHIHVAYTITDHDTGSTKIRRRNYDT